MRSLRNWVAPLALLCLASVAQAQSPSTVLVVANQNNASSIALAQYYMNARQIPQQNLCLVNWQASDTADTTTTAVYKASIATPVYAQIAKLPEIDYIVLCRNLPSKLSDATCSVDSALTTNNTTKRFNPYAYEGNGFTAKLYGMRLVTRLDGWSWADAQALVDNSMKASRGTFFFLDRDPTKDLLAGYGSYDFEMLFAYEDLIAMHFSPGIDQTTAFVDPPKAMAGYFSWGSNDSHFNAANFKALTFSPGAIAETLVSTSGEYLRSPGPAGAQSQIAQLIHNGVTGIKGYVSEPLLTATADPDQLFCSYGEGYNLAEAFYSASMYIGWKDVVIGDPLCAPYK